MATDTVLVFARPRRAFIKLVAVCLSTWMFLTGISTNTLAQQIVERMAKGQPGKDIRIGVYINLEPDCTSGPLPVVRVISKPTHGTVTIKRVRISGANYKHCVALEVPGRVALYRSNPGFTGVDVVTLEVRYPGIRAEMQRIRILVSDPPWREI